jgi:hypothetical protein
VQIVGFMNCEDAMANPKWLFPSLLLSVSLCARPGFAQSAPPESDQEVVSVYVQSLPIPVKSIGDGFVHYNTPMPDSQRIQLNNGTQTPYDEARANFYVKAGPFPYVSSYAYAIDSPGFNATGGNVSATAYFDLSYWVKVGGPAGSW